MTFIVHSKCSTTNLNYRSTVEVDKKGIVSEVSHAFVSDYVGLPFNFLVQHMVDMHGVVSVYKAVRILLNVPTEDKNEGR